MARVESPEDSGRLARGEADLVISRGNVAAWERTFGALAHFRALHGALKRGGVLAVIEARGEHGASFRRMMEAGAVSEEHVIAVAEVAGFRLVGRSGAGGAGSHMKLKFLKP